MVRSVAFDESIQAWADRAVLARAGAEVGLLVGRRAAGGRDYVLRLVRTPDLEGEPALRVTRGAGGAAAAGGKGGSGKGGGGAAGLAIDAEWVAEHAVQVERLLPGGLDVLGVYALCPAAAAAGGGAALAAALARVGAELAAAGGAGAAASGEGLLALLVDAAAARVTARELAGGALRPAEARGAALAPAMAEARARYALDARVAAAPGGPKPTVADAVGAALRWDAAQRLAPAAGLVGGAPPPPGAQVGDLAPPGGGPLEVELLPPAAAAAAAAAGAGAHGAAPGADGRGRYERAGALALSGVLDCRAWVHRREPAAAAVDAVKADAARSLRARLAVLVEAAEAAEAAAADLHADATRRGPGEGQPNQAVAPPPTHPLLWRAAAAAAFAPRLPRRAVARWAGGGGAYCDYLVEGEGAEEALARLAELVGAGAVDAAAFECEEATAAGGGGGARAAPKARAASGWGLASCGGAAGAALVVAAVGYMIMG